MFLVFGVAVDCIIACTFLLHVFSIFRTGRRRDACKVKGFRFGFVVQILIWMFGSLVHISATRA
jgi:hypothetical protein